MLTDEQHAAVDRFLGEIAPDDAPLAKAILTAGEQSNGDPTATSPKGARGLMQLTPIALKDLGRDPATFDYTSPAESLRAGVEYIQLLKSKYGFTNPLQIAAAYNAGPSVVQKAIKAGTFTELPEETQAYIRRLQPVLGEAPTPAPAPSRMPRMTDALDPVDRTPRDKAVAIPDVPSLVASTMAQERDAQPWYARLPQRMLEPPVELGVQAVRSATGSPMPPVPVDRLLTDAAQAAGLVAPGLPIGRLGSAAIQGASGLASGMQDAAERHRTTGRSWVDQVRALDTTDLLNLGTQVVTGATLGAIFPGTKPKALGPTGGLAQAREDLGSMMARDTMERALPPPRQGEVTAAFGRLNREAVVDATGWRRAILEHAAEGKGIPSEVKAVADRLVPEMQTVTRPGSLAGHTFLPPRMPVEAVQIPTGRYFAPVGDLLDANRALGNMVNVPVARQTGEVMGHTVGNLNALRKALTAEIADTLPKGQRTLYQAARDTAKDVAQDTAAMRRVEKFLVPDEGLFNGVGLYKDLTANAEKRIASYGYDRYQQLLAFARSVKTISSTPERASLMQRAVTHGLETAVGLGGYYAGGLPGAAAVLAPRVLYGLATSQTGRALFDTLARAPLYSRTFLTALGRLSASVGTFAAQTQRDAGPLPTPAPQPVPVGAP